MEAGGPSGRAGAGASSCPRQGAEQRAGIVIGFGLPRGGRHAPVVALRVTAAATRQGVTRPLLATARQGSTRLPRTLPDSGLCLRPTRRPSVRTRGLRRVVEAAQRDLLRHAASAAG